jgi:beta-lactamase class D
MKNLFAVLAFFILIYSNTYSYDKTIKKEWAKYYKDYNIEGCFVLYDMKADKYYIYNDKRANEGFLPASTFKIPNSLIGLETGAVKDENEIIKWNGVKNKITEWNHDQDMKNAIKVSCVWFYQEIARRIGIKRMQHYINAIGYGNKNIGDKIDNFWLQGKLRITAMQQIEFLKKLYKNDLPFSRRTMETVKSIMVTDTNYNRIYHSKTGWSVSGDKGNGWWVGYIEQGDDVYFFANNIDINKDEDAGARIDIAKNILRSMQLYR